MLAAGAAGIGCAPGNVAPGSRTVVGGCGSDSPMGGWPAGGWLLDGAGSGSASIPEPEPPDGGSG
jgi:hypothetical protein